MRDRGKAVETYNTNNDYHADYYSSSSDLPCKKHPHASSIGICAYCLKDRLSKLACSECGEQSLSSCSCSDFSPTRNSCTGDIGSVGRISFLIENEKKDVLVSSSKPKHGEKIEQALMLKRSSSSCVEIKKDGFWKIGKFFRKKRKEKDFEKKSVAGCGEKSDLSSMAEYMGVSRSRSLCSFRGGEIYGSENGEYLPVSAARSSISAARSSSVTGGLILDAARKSGFSEAEPRRSGFSETEPRKSCFSESENRKSCFSEAEARRSGCSESEPRKSSFEPDNGIDIKGTKKGGTIIDLDNGPRGANRRIFSLKESDFNGADDSSFIDLNIDFSSELNKEQHRNVRLGSLFDTRSAFGSRRASDLLGPEFGGSLGSSVGHGLLNKGGSCRISVSDRVIKTGRKSFKGWRWIFKQNSNEKSGRKSSEGLMI